MRTLALVLGLGTIGCGFHSSSERGGADSVPDAAPIDTNLVDAGPCVSWPGLNIDPCNVALGGQAPVIAATGSYLLDTDNGMLASSAGTVTLPGALIAQASGGPMVRVVNASVLVISANATLTVVGTHPVIFVVHGDANIEGAVDASARIDGSGTRTAGPGGNDVSQCTGAIGADGVDAPGAGGGGGAGGGAYGGNGGDGGDGAGGGHGGKGTKGKPTGNAMIEPLRGGCRGGVGGDDVNIATDDGGRPGDGGGAIEITALGQITINGTIAAGGSGGGAGGSVVAGVNAGGGGGGSGGAIVIDGDTSTVTAIGKLCANGGGGGEGGQLTAISSPGAAAICTTARAPGGATLSVGGDGGDGGAAASVNGADGMPGMNNAAGGGGGGGVGRIRVRGRMQRTINGAIVTPTASM